MTEYRRIGDYISLVDDRNTAVSITNLVGLTIAKKFIPSVANINGTDLSNYKIIRKGQFACSLMQVSRDGKFPVAMYAMDEPAIMSPAYPMFEVTKLSEILPEYMMLWFSRSEFDREACFYAVGGVRGSLDWEDFCNMKIPVPDIATQRRIVAEYQAVEKRIATNERLIAKLEETAQAIYKKMFVDDIDLGHLPDGWKMGTLEDIADLITAGTVPNYADESDLRVLGQKCIKEHKINLDLAKTHLPKANCIFLEYGDVLINSTGDGTLGRVAKVNFNPVNLAFDSNMTLVRGKKFYKEFIAAFLQTKEDCFVQISQGSTNQTRLYCSMIRPVPVVIPNLQSAQLFNSRIEPIAHDLRLRISENKTLSTMKTVLLSRISSL